MVTWRSAEEQDLLRRPDVSAMLCGGSFPGSSLVWLEARPVLVLAKDTLVPGLQPPYHLPIYFFVPKQLQKGAWSISVNPQILSLRSHGSTRSYVQQDLQLCWMLNL